MWKTWSSWEIYDKYMLFISVFGKAFLVFQIVSIVINSSSQDASFLSYVLYLITSLSWLVFGLIQKNTIIVISSYVGLIGALIAMNFVIAYKENKNDIL